MPDGKDWSVPDIYRFAIHDAAHEIWYRATLPPVPAPDRVSRNCDPNRSLFVPEERLHVCRASQFDARHGCAVNVNCLRRRLERLRFSSSMTTAAQVND